MSATCIPIEGLGNSREQVGLSGIVEVLTWRCALETSQDPDYLRSGLLVVVYPKSLDKLDSILSTGDIGLGPTNVIACGRHVEDGPFGSQREYMHGRFQTNRSCRLSPSSWRWS
jgi:hypothetical protein